MSLVSRKDRERVAAAVAVVAIHAALGWALLAGLGTRAVEAASAELKTFEVWEQPPPPPTEPAPPDVRELPSPKEPRPDDPEGAAAPPGLRDTPTQLVAPEPVVPLPVPPPLPTAPVAGVGTAEAAGASDVPGPGTGAGGVGEGLGSGRFGTGTGGGGAGGGRPSPPRLIAGGMRESDLRGLPLRAGVPHVVGMRWRISPAGRVERCQITRRSGVPALDERTCRLVQRRFRFRPARDMLGRAVPADFEGEQEWGITPEPEPIDVEPTIPDDE